MADFSLGTAELGTAVNMSGLNTGLSEAKALSKSELESAASGGLGVFQSVFVVGLGNLVAQGISSLSGALTSMFSTMIKEAEDAERTQAQLGAVLQSTGGKAGVTAQMANELAASIQKTSTVSDDAVIAGENMLLTFTGIGKDVFPQATHTMVDMATAMNGGMTPSAEQLSKTAIMLGKALQDPEKGASALRKVGVALTDQQVEQIKTFNPSGDTMKAQKLILNELSTEFGGSAAAATHTYSGAMEMLKNTFLDVAENAGGPLINSLHGFADVLSSPVIINAVAGIANVLSGALASAIDFVSGLLPSLIQGWLDIQPAVQGAGKYYRASARCSAIWLAKQAAGAPTSSTHWPAASWLAYRS
jgi:hypothetical protein